MQSSQKRPLKVCAWELALLSKLKYKLKYNNKYKIKYNTIISQIKIKL